MVGFDKEKKNTQIADFISHLILFIHLYFFGLKYLIVIIPTSLLIYHLGHSIFMHRHLSHGQFTFGKGPTVFLHFMAIISSMGKIPGYIAIHLKHHTFSGDKHDPHEWRHHGFGKIFFSNWKVYDEKHDKKVMINSLRKTPYMRFFTNYHYTILYFFMPFFGGITAMCFWWKQFSVILVHVPLFFGYSTESSQGGINNILLWPILWGDEKHADHHSSPGRSKLSNYDLQYYFARVLEKV